MRILEEGDVRVVVLGGFVVGFFLFLRFGGGRREYWLGGGGLGGGRWEMVEAEGCCCHHVFSLYVCALFAACIPLESRSARGVRL